jgi:response regulator RpfG family c-di-GMP phosphodiesterase
MIVYVESNFVLEVAFAQGQAESCQGILELCRTGRAHLVMPAFSVAEPFHALIGRIKQRKRVAEELDVQIRELARRTSLTAQAEALRPLASMLIRSQEDERIGLRSAMDRILAFAELIPLEAGLIGQAATLEDDLFLSPQDSIVLASVLQHLERVAPAESCFLNRNTNDFDEPDVVARLNEFGCKLLPSFDAGLGYIRSAASPA